MVSTVDFCQLHGVFSACAPGVGDPVMHGVVVRRAPGQRARPAALRESHLQQPLGQRVASILSLVAHRRLGFTLGGLHTVPSSPQCPGLLSPASQCAPLCPHLCPSHILTGSELREYMSALPGLGTSCVYCRTCTPHCVPGELTRGHMSVLAQMGDCVQVAEL